MKALILGIGNVLLGDEGIGIRIIEELNNRFDLPDTVETLDGGTAGIELLRYMEGKDLLIIIDAMRLGHKPGTVFRVEGEDVQKQFLSKVSPHQIGLSDLLAAGILSDALPEKIVLFGVEPEKLETGIYLTDSVAESITKLIPAIIDELTGFGFAYPPQATSHRVSLFWS